MNAKEIIYLCFYLIFFSLSIWAGTTNGFTDSLMPPVPFGIEFFTLLIGGILLSIDFAKHQPATFKKVRVHVLGLTANSFVMLYVLISALQGR